jgi:hypothetical protein
MDEREKGLYETLKDEMILRVLLSAKRKPSTGVILSEAGGGVEGSPPQQILTIDAQNASVLCGKLSQLANGAVYSDDGQVARIHDRKLDALEDLIEAANGNPLLVAYWYQHDIDRIRQRFPEIRVLKSSEEIRDWNAGKIDVALIHPASAGHGLNIQEGGHILIWFGLTWSLELYQQTNARLWRQGQKSTVTVHHIVTRGTVDENVLAALEAKDMTQEKLIAAVKAQF